MIKTSICAVDGNSAPRAVKLLGDFFAESGFPGDRDSISLNLRAMLADPNHWAAIVRKAGEALGVMTVTTMPYVEWGRLGEIGDLYVVPDARQRGVARLLVEAGLDWCRARGCSAVSVVVTEQGELRDGLGLFYGKLGFLASGRRIYTMRLEP